MHESIDNKLLFKAVKEFILTANKQRLEAIMIEMGNDDARYDRIEH